MDRDTFLVFVIVLAIAFAPFCIAVSRKHNHWIWLLLFNILDFVFVLVAFASPSAISISIAGIFWVVLWSKAMSRDNRQKTKILKEQLKSLDYCQTCMSNSSYIKDLYRDKGLSVLFDGVYELVSMDKTNSIATKILGFSNEPCKKTIDEYKKEYKEVLKSVRLFGPTCTHCKDKVRTVIRNYLKTFSPLLYNEAKIFEESNDATTHECPFCLEVIAKGSKKCPCCAENLE